MTCRSIQPPALETSILKLETLAAFLHFPSRSTILQHIYSPFQFQTSSLHTSPIYHTTHSAYVFCLLVFLCQHVSSMRVGAWSFCLLLYSRFLECYLTHRRQYSIHICWTELCCKKPFRLLLGASTPDNLPSQNSIKGYKQLLFLNALQISTLLIFKVWFSIYLPADNLCSVSNLLFTKPSGQSVNLLPTIWRISFLQKNHIIDICQDLQYLAKSSISSLSGNVYCFLSKGGKSSALLLRACQASCMKGKVYIF